MPTLLRAQGLSKSYPGVQALKEVSVSIKAGEVLAVVGENGAGKSTLMKILSGVISPDEGKLFLGDDSEEEILFPNVSKALDAGVALIHQELNLAGSLSVAANIFLGHEANRFGFLDGKSIEHDANLLLEKVGLEIDGGMRLEDLPIGKQQLVEIARALSYQANVIIFDEPTSSLSQTETQTLFRLIAELKAQGIGQVYISHRLNEVTEIADRVFVLKDGEYQGQLVGHQIRKEEMISLMVGRDLGITASRDEENVDETILELEHVVTSEYPRESNSFKLNRGEILGIAGLVGAGRTSLLEGLFGVVPFLSGKVTLDGVPVELVSSREACDAGLGLIPEDRKLNGLLLEQSVGENISLASLARDSRLGFVDRGLERTLIQKGIDALGIKTSSSHTKAENLSGGNQQKIVIAKWLETNPKVLLMDEPTRGVDVGAKQEIYDLMREQTSLGRSIIFVSSDLEELLRIADRVLVMYEGSLVGELGRSEMSEESIMRLATGAVEEEAAA